MKSHFHETARFLYEQSKNQPNPELQAKHLKASRLLYDFSHNMKHGENRFLSLKALLDTSEKKPQAASSDIIEQLIDDFERDV